MVAWIERNEFHFTPHSTQRILPTLEIHSSASSDKLLTIIAVQVYNKQRKSTTFPSGKTFAPSITRQVIPSHIWH